MKLYFKFVTCRAGLKKRSLPIDDEGSATFSYCEKGVNVKGKPCIVFVHGFSSNKEAWLPIIKNIPRDYHCITIDLPAHGETRGLNEEQYSVEKFVEKLQLKGLTEPMCLVGGSLGGAIVSMFALKYPSYVSMICLLAPPANEQCETELIQQLRQGEYSLLLPETPTELQNMINNMAVKRIRASRIFLNGIIGLRSTLLEEHKKVLTSLLQNDYLNLEHQYQQLTDLKIPALILWGRQDMVYTADGADYFHQLMPHAEKIVLDECGHFMAIDKPREIAEHILRFFDRHNDCEVKALTLITDID